MVEIERYKELIKKLAEQKSTLFINNSSPDHAVAMIERLFLEAKGTVRLLSDHMTPYIYDLDSIKDAVIQFLEGKENDLKVIMLFQEDKRDNLKKNGFLVSLAKYKDRISLYEANKEFKKVPCHFMVVKTIKDTYALRLEVDLQHHIATGTFNAGENGRQLCDIFDDACKNRATPIETKEVWLS